MSSNWSSESRAHSPPLEMRWRSGNEMESNMFRACGGASSLLLPQYAALAHSFSIRSSRRLYLSSFSSSCFRKIGHVKLPERMNTCLASRLLVKTKPSNLRKQNLYWAPMGRNRSSNEPKKSSLSHGSAQGSSPKLGAIEVNNLDVPEKGVDIDGSILEGGGQILRISAALSAITGTPIRVRNIRANRSRPGLRPQHLAGLQLVARICNGDLRGGTVGSSTITLIPRHLEAGTHKADPGTAGSCCLLAQAAVPVLLFASQRGSEGGVSRLKLKGGTDAELAPPADYLQHVFIPTVQRLWGLSLDFQLDCRGFYPRGGGSMSLGVPSLTEGSGLRAVQMTDRGSIDKVCIRAFSAGKLPLSIAVRMANAAKTTLGQELPKEVSIEQEITHCSQETPPAFGDGSGILIVAQTSGGCLLGAGAPGQKGVSSEEIGMQVALELLEDLDHGGCLDRCSRADLLASNGSPTDMLLSWEASTGMACRLEDQVIIFMALSGGSTPSLMTSGPPTLHTRTAMTIAEKLTAARFKVTAPPGGEKHYTISCVGSGFLA